MGVAEAEVTDITSGKASQKMPKAYTMCIIAYTLILSVSRSQIFKHICGMCSNMFKCVQTMPSSHLAIDLHTACSRLLCSSSLSDVTA